MQVSTGSSYAITIVHLCKLETVNFIAELWTLFILKSSFFAFDNLYLGKFYSMKYKDYIRVFSIDRVSSKYGVRHCSFVSCCSPRIL